MARLPQKISPKDIPDISCEGNWREEVIVKNEDIDSIEASSLYFQYFLEVVDNAVYLNLSSPHTHTIDEYYIEIEGRSIPFIKIPERIKSKALLATSREEIRKIISSIPTFEEE